MTLAEILKDSSYKLTQFSLDKINSLEESITTKEIKGKNSPYFVCQVRRKEIRLTPEEVIRQLYVMVLTQDYQYPVSRMELEYGVTFGRETKRADIVVFDKDQTTTPYLIVELKKPS
ncbi:MAG: type I restriction enzyme HsdR N-terminal domain-containing protein [Bacteroidales bacterium]|jgi:type I restriction enzyme M protein